MTHSIRFAVNMRNSADANGMWDNISKMFIVVDVGKIECPNSVVLMVRFSNRVNKEFVRECEMQKVDFVVFGNRIGEK